MNNKGQITVFLTLMVGCLLGLLMMGITVVNRNCSESKAAMVTKSAMSGIKAGYNSYIFENYHILLFDKTLDGAGEAALEEQLKADIECNLGEGFAVEEIRVQRYRSITEEECLAFKEQIDDYAVYGLAQKGWDKIVEATKDNGAIPPEIIEEMETAKNSEEMNVKGEEEGKGQSDDKLEDPREFTENMSSMGLMSIVLPEDMDVSGEEINLSGLPSFENGIGISFFQNVNKDFDNMDFLLDDIGKENKWEEDLVSSGVGLAYAGEMFNCATQNVNEDTIFNCELEYIVCGENSDYKNLKGVVNRIIAIRLPVNYGYLIKDKSKMSEIRSISIPLSFIVLIPEPVLTYLIAGCWSYVEAIVDVRCLLEGKSMEFTKNKDNWITDLNDFESSVNYDGKESEKGLNYHDYMIILVSTNMDKTYYRMLDIMELNTKQFYPNFKMENAMVGFQVNAIIEGEYGRFYIDNYEEY